MSRRILEHSPFGREYPKNQGLFGHSSAVRRKNMLIISGGYHGSISSDILAYTLPYGLSLKRNDKVIYYREKEKIKILDRIILLSKNSVKLIDFI